jgi:hypothetical protein
VEYVADFVPVEKKFYPFAKLFRSLSNDSRTHPDEQGLRDKLTISALSSALKAEKRSELARKLVGVVNVHVETQLRTGQEGKAINERKADEEQVVAALIRA